MLQKNESSGKILFHVFLLVLSIGYLLSAFSLGAPIVEAQLRPSFFPLLLGLLAVAFSAVLLMREIKAARASRQSGDQADATGDRLSYMIIAATALYILLFSLIGYVLSSVLYVFAIMVIFSNREKWLQKMAISILIVGLGYLVFEQIFGVRLPALWE
ncbi:tripartite tricarboxylate transporter TctB family protein [Marinobacterium rhizophilum]|uniref:Tripartite tricarboxylate transporter TctB family protein n=1 Tax=Marinobacterium rhizophilum TaxID=420402 RepID=A0ABY5HH85_9GAMM|nr:tripartite tricarboxylate transporter TctB family protein [Marinobacterium rhizophilum]UTW10654.1 tripartite tricarboxylate transporter TctB family protein [Marinobacterium rhizophilum]